MEKVKTIEVKNDKNGNPMKITTFENDKKVFVNSKWDAPVYESVIEGAEFELYEDNGFNKIKYDKPAQAPRQGNPAIAKAMERKEAGIEKTMDRKEEGIMVSSTASGATNLVIAYFPEFTQVPIEQRTGVIFQKWAEIRNELLAKWDVREPFKN
jgi:hypothetical protein